MQLLSHTFRSILRFIIPLLLLSSCSNNNASESPINTEIPLLNTTTVHEKMVWILDPAADVIWTSAGTIITENGEQDLSPTSDEDWRKVVSGATIIAESAHLLNLHGESYNETWFDYTQGLSSAGWLARNAALAKDSQALFDAGGRIYEVCRACHSQFMLDTEEEK